MWNHRSAPLFAPETRRPPRATLKGPVTGCWLKITGRDPEGSCHGLLAEITGRGPGSVLAIPYDRLTNVSETLSAQVRCSGSM